MKINLKYIKFISSLLLVFILSIPITVLGIELKDSSLPRIVDNANLLTSEEEAILLDKINLISNKYSMDIVLLTTNDFEGKTVSSYADDYFDYNNYGYGDPNDITSGDGLLFLININSRDYYTSTKGKSIKYFTNKRLANLGDEVKPYLSNGDFYEAFNVYLDKVEGYRGSNPKTKNIVIAAFICLALTGIVVGIMAFSMKSARKKSSALDYVNKNDFNLTYSRDIYTHSNTSRTKKAESSNSSGGTSTHSSSSGSTHGGGGGKF